MTGRPSINRSQFHLTRDSESAALETRLLSSLPAATFEMETLCRLAGIHATRDIPTAAVELTFRPRLMLNPDFVAKHCERDEHLFLLVMHELWHIILAHTRLYPRMTIAHNIAFDAVINAGLARQFGAPEYRGFLEALNPADSFPGCLLRPPEGWPETPHYPDCGPSSTLEVIERLYPANNRGRWSTPLYEEILALLQKWLEEKIANGEAILVPTLLGDHESDNDSRALDDPFMRETLKRMVKSWPNPLFPVRQRGDGGSADDLLSAIQVAPEDARRAFAQVLRRALGQRPGRQKRRARVSVMGTPIPTVIPDGRDRLASARRRLGVQSLLWNQPGSYTGRAPEKPSKAHVYLDVSGSMSRLTPHLLGLLLPYVAGHQALVFQFSTVVEPLPLDQLKRGKLRTTSGTSINAVLEHVMVAQPPLKRILIVTDGYVGTPAAHFVQSLAARPIAIHIVLPNESNYRTDLQAIARSFTILPPFQHVASQRPSFP